MDTAINIIGWAVVILLLASLTEGILNMSAALDRITAEVSESRTATDSALALIAGLVTQIRDNANDPAALTALADSLDAQQADLAAAVTENTPAA